MHLEHKKFRNVDKEGLVSVTNWEVAEMTEILLSFPGSDIANLACTKTSYLQQRLIAVNTFNIRDFTFTDILQ